MYLQEKIPFTNARATRSKRLQQTEVITAKTKGASAAGKSDSNAYSVTAGVVIKKMQWARQTRQWAKGTRLQMQFKINKKFEFLEGVVIKNSDLTLLDCFETDFSVYFIDGETVDFDHDRFFQNHTAKVLQQSNLSTMLTNNLLFILSKRPPTETIRKALKRDDIRFQSQLQIDTDKLLNSEPDSQERTDLIRKIVNRFKSILADLSNEVDVVEIFLRWIKDIAHFQIPDLKPIDVPLADCAGLIAHQRTLSQVCLRVSVVGTLPLLAADGLPSTGPRHLLLNARPCILVQGWRKV